MKELYRVRKGKKEDREEVLGLVERAAARLCAKVGSPDQQARWVAQQKDLFGERLDDKESDLIVAQSNWGIVGCVYVEHGGKLARERGLDAYLGGLYSGARGLGIGSRLNQEALLCVAGRGGGSVYARLPKSSKTAVREMESLGFRRVGEQESSILPGSIWVELEMQLLHGALEPGMLSAPLRRNPK